MPGAAGSKRLNSESSAKSRTRRLRSGAPGPRPPPWEVLEGGNWHVVNRFCATTDKFVVSPPIVSVFERMQFIRGTEALLMDLGYGVKELLKLRDIP